MKFTLEKDAISKICIIAAMAKKKDTAIMHLSTENDAVKVSIHLENEFFLETSVNAEVIESGECNLKAFRLKAALNQYPDSCCVCLKKGHLRICADADSCNKLSKVEISTVETHFNPLIFDMKDCYMNVNIPSAHLVNLLSDAKSSYLSSTDTPILTSTKVKLNQDFLQADSMDIGRFTRSKLESNEAYHTDSSINLTNQFAKKIIDVTKAFKFDGDIQLMNSTKSIKTIIGNIILIGKKVAIGKNDLFADPMYDDAFSTENKAFHASVSVDELMQLCIATQIVSIEQGEIATREPLSIFKRDGENFIVCKYETVDGNIYREIPITVSTDNTLDSFDINVNLRAFFNGISRFEGTANIYISNSSFPLLMTGNKKLEDGSSLRQSQLFSLVSRKHL